VTNQLTSNSKSIMKLSVLIPVTMKIAHIFFSWIKSIVYGLYNNP